MSTIPSDSPTVHDQHSDAGAAFTPGDSDYAEMAEVFEYDEQPTEAELEAMYADWQKQEAERVSFANLQPLPELRPITTPVAKLNPQLWPKLSA